MIIPIFWRILWCILKWNNGEPCKNFFQHDICMKITNEKIVALVKKSTQDFSLVYVFYWHISKSDAKSQFVKFEDHAIIPWAQSCESQEIFGETETNYRNDRKWLTNFVTPDLKLHNQYCTKHHKKLRGQKIYPFVLITINNQLLVDPNIGP